MQFIDLQAQYKSLKQKIDRRIHAVLDHGKYIMGPEVVELEQQLAAYVNREHCISCANGTDALQLALMALDIGPGDAVLCPTFTFFATAEAIAHVGAEPIFVDVDAKTFNTCPQDLRNRINTAKKLGKELKAFIAVDLFGQPADYQLLLEICHQHQLFVIEDAAQGFGGAIGERKAGSFGDIATTSFFPAKPLGCYGDGGALFCDDPQLAKTLQSLRVHGKGEHKYDNVRIGVNSRLDTIQAAILLEKLAVFDQELQSRQNIAEHYENEIGELINTPQIPSGFSSSWAQYSLLAKSSSHRDQLMANLKAQNIPTAIYYGKCLHLQPAFAQLGHKQGDFPQAESLSERVFSLPISPYLTQLDQEKVVIALKKGILD